MYKYKTCIAFVGRIIKKFRGSENKVDTFIFFMEKHEHLFQDLALSGREPSISRVENCAELFGTIGSFWDGLGAELWPLLCFVVKKQGPR